MSGDIDRRKLLERGIGLGAIALGSPVAARAVSAGKPGKAATPDATEIAAMIRRKDVTALEVIDQAITRAEAIQSKLNFLVTPTFERARDRAKTMPLTGPFAGVPYLIKDMYDTIGATTRYGSRATKPLPPAASQGVMMNTLESAGLISIGKSALGEFGFLPTVEPLAFGPTRSPWNPGRSTGGSSGGSAAAVAAGVVPMADAADGGGSIRIPASACGLFGLKPSRGRMVGDQPKAGKLDVTVEHAVCRSVRDSATLFALTERTGTGATLEPVGVVSAPSKRRLRVGVVLNSLSGHTPDSEVKAGVATTTALLETLGHKVDSTAWPFDGAAFSRGFGALWSMAALEVTKLFQALTGRAPDASQFEPLTLAMAALAAKLSPEEIAATLKQFEAVTAAYDGWFDKYDVILSPVLLTPPVAIGEINGELPLEVAFDRCSKYADYTAVHNVVGAPAMSVPLHWTRDGLPVGMQFAARRGQERILFELAFELERARPWASRRPPLFS
ncbi:amidase [Sphingomonas sp.]|uniref:amidase n=1 Tax=Sphingomonas sp. TaxID=28214 RepID=UPI003D6CA43B